MQKVKHAVRNKSSSIPSSSAVSVDSHRLVLYPGGNKSIGCKGNGAPWEIRRLRCTTDHNLARSWRRETSMGPIPMKPVRGNTCLLIWQSKGNALNATRSLHELIGSNGDLIDRTVRANGSEAEAIEQSADLKRLRIFRDRGDPVIVHCRPEEPCRRATFFFSFPSVTA